MESSSVISDEGIKVKFTTILHQIYTGVFNIRFPS